MSSSRTSVEVAGHVLGERYRLVRPVAQGGLASVWEAEHVTLHRKLAVKFLLETGAHDTEASQRFLREAQVASSVKHPNVLDIIDFGFTDDTAATSKDGTALGVPYMVMELLSGETLEQVLEREERLSVERAVDVTSGVLRGLAAVHDAGIVHRDVKPDNVFLVADDEGPYPKLVDFGLSRHVGPSHLTMQGAVLGTPLYMAPEQVLGGAELDARVDLYATGVMLYEMLAGRVPFCGETPTETFQLIQSAEAEPLTKLAPGVPEALARVVEKAMQKSPDARFADARAMRAALLASMPERAVDRPSLPQPPRASLPEPSASVEIVREDEPTPTPAPVPSPISGTTSPPSGELRGAGGPGALGIVAAAVALAILAAGAWLFFAHGGERADRVVPVGPFIPIGVDAALVDAGPPPGRRGPRVPR